MIDDDWGSAPTPEPQNIIVSMIREAQDVETVPVDPSQILRDIGTNRWAKQVEAVQAAYAKGGKDAAAPFKKKLPGILFSGNFRKRNANELIEHSGLICVDLDHLDNQVDVIKEQVCADPHILAAFRSPTGSGLKVVLRCDPSRPHIEAFKAAEQFMLERFGLEIDKACKDVNRICFVSHDPDIFIAEHAQEIPYPAKPVQYRPTNYTNGTGDSPGDDYNARGNWESLLLGRGWHKVGANGWRRPDKTDGISATWNKVAEYPNTFYVFSSSTEFEVGKVYHPWHIYALLECGGDFKLAAKKLGESGFGKVTKPRAQLPLDQMIEESGGITAKPKVELTPRPITSYAYPSDDDPNILIGKDDYLGKGGGLLFVSHAGAGKSSWIMDACMMWALGRTWMGLRCARPLRSLIIQAEDSDRYIGKISASFKFKNRLDDKECAQLGDNCMIVRLKGVSGPAFFQELKRLTELHSPDLVIVNPIYLYAEGDIGRSEFAQPFLLGLDQVNKEEKFAYILIHHTGKPTAKGKDGKRAEVEDWESAYMGFGSSYLANWPRCTALLEPIPGESGKFLIKLGKGGFNAGLTKEVAQGAGVRLEPSTRIAIRHSTEKMEVDGRERPVFYWEEDKLASEVVNPKGAGRKQKYEIETFFESFPGSLDTGLPAGQIHRKVDGYSGIPLTSFKDLCERAYRDGKIKRGEKPGSGIVYWRTTQDTPLFK